ncbi:MAG TPA: hypothetical protein VL993_09730 [Stellaceae bacterium]|nr:hypothetical protein [Stellaceae bacterium]
MKSGYALLIALLATAPAAATFAQSNDQAAPSDQATPIQPQTGPVVKSPYTSPNAAGETGTAGSTLSKTLSRSGGVITPPDVNDPNVKEPPPAGNTPVIPPPGTPGGNQDIQPK